MVSYRLSSGAPWEGQPVILSLSPDSGYLENSTLILNSAGYASTIYHAGDKPAVVTLTAKFHEGTVRTATIYLLKGEIIHINPQYNLLDENNQIKKDIKIVYKILPEEYVPISIEVDITREGTARTLSYPSAEKGVVVLSAGSSYELGKYEAQLVLNRGYSSEYRSDETKNFYIFKLEAVNIDASVPEQTKVNYHIEPPGFTLRAVYFKAPGMRKTKYNVSGDFYFTFDQNKLRISTDPYLPKVNKIQLTIKGNINNRVDISVVRAERRGPLVSEMAIGKVFLSEAIVTIPVKHNLFEIWHSIRYSIPVLNESRTLWVGKSSASIWIADTGLLSRINTWHEVHFYQNIDDRYLQESMTDVKGKTLPPQGRLYQTKECSANRFFEKYKNLTGYAKIYSLSFTGSGGPIQWYPIANTVIDSGLE